MIVSSLYLSDSVKIVDGVNRHADRASLHSPDLPILRKSEPPHYGHQFQRPVIVMIAGLRDGRDEDLECMPSNFNE
jgi:hypothetical protein